MSRIGSRRYIPLRQRGLSLTDQLMHANVTVKTSIHGFDVPTNFRSKKCSLVCLVQILGMKATVLANLCSAQKPTNNDWSVPRWPSVDNTRTSIYAAVLLAALQRYKYNAETLGSSAAMC